LKLEEEEEEAESGRRLLETQGEWRSRRRSCWHLRITATVGRKPWHFTSHSLRTTLLLSDYLITSETSCKLVDTNIGSKSLLGTLT